MRDRLVELILKAREECTSTSCFQCEYQDKEMPKGCIPRLIADYLIENGVIVPPCKVGDWVYILRNGELHRNHICQMHIAQTYAQTFFSCYGEKFGVEQIGKTVFLTREEAEQALKGEHDG